MNVQTIDIDIDQARQDLAAYRSLTVQTEEDRAIAAGLAAVVDGARLINLREALTAGGLRENDGYPALAVCRADRPWCSLSTDHNGTVYFNGLRFSASWDSRNKEGVGHLRFERLLPGVKHAWGDVRSQVPIIPARIRNDLRITHTGRKSYWVLWEVDEWAKAPRPPGDPALIQPVHGDLWALVATWDLTPLERAVLGGRS